MFWKIVEFMAGCSIIDNTRALAADFSPNYEMVWVDILGSVNNTLRYQKKGTIVGLIDSKAGRVQLHIPIH